MTRRRYTSQNATLAAVVSGCLLLAGAPVCSAQSAPDSRPALSGMPRRILEDQRILFASPFHVRKQDLVWMVPFGLLTGLTIAGDRNTMQSHVRSNPAAVAASNAISNTGFSALAAIPFALYGLGRMHDNPHFEQGAVLAGEAAADSLIMDTALKFSFGRERPGLDHSAGGFFRSAWGDPSFPSAHSMVAWSVASALAHRYPGWLTQATVYSLAAAASLPRITAEKHFPSDVLVGGVLGWLVGRAVFSRRHTDWDPAVAGMPATRTKAVRAQPAAPAFYVPERTTPRRPRGPVFVPMDSWIYSALARLAALGYISDGAAGLRPWTREECIRQLGEAEEAEAYRAEQPEAAELIRALHAEFDRDDESSRFVELTSLYGRYLGLSGKPLSDGYNFGQTIVNDYGRPLSEGSNTIAGFSATAVDGRLSFYARGELQHSPPFVSPAFQLRPIAHQLQPVLPDSSGGTDRFRPLEMYAGIQLGGWALTAGKQELWWGPGEAGPLSFSNNAEPFYSFRFTSTSPIALPGALRNLGRFRVDLVGGKLSGHQFPPRPLLNGQKLTWNVTKNLELGFTRWSLFDGAGVHGFNAGSVIRNLFANGATFGNAVDPGDRKSGFDFRWRLPWLGATLYSDFYADDEPSPLTSPRRSAFSPGVYLPRLPGLPRWDLRVEAPSTRLATSDQGGFFLYWNSVYNDANTNRGYLLGNWVGRDGRGLSVQSTYWHSARSRIEFRYRQNRIGPAFLPGGGTQDDAGAGGSFQIRPDCTLRVSAQYEHYRIPLLGAPRSNVAVSLEMTYEPRWRPFHN